MAEYGGQAAFLSAGGYHHHVGANTWRSGGAARRRRARPRCGASRSCCRTPPRAISSPSASRRAVMTVEEHADGPLARDPSGNAFTLLTRS